MASEVPFSPSELAELRSALIRQRDALRTARSRSSDDARGLGDPEPEAGDQAERVVEQDSALAVEAMEESVLAEIEHALSKFPLGTYGISEDSGEPIPIARLRALPWARRTADEEESGR